MIQLLDKCSRGNKIAPLWHSCLASLSTCTKGVQFNCPFALMQQFLIALLFHHQITVKRLHSMKLINDLVIMYLIMILKLVACNEPGNFNCIFLHAYYKIPSPTVKFYEILLKILKLQLYSSSHHLMTSYQMLIGICTLG